MSKQKLKASTELDIVDEVISSLLQDKKKSRTLSLNEMQYIEFDRYCKEIGISASHAIDSLIKTFNTRYAQNKQRK